MRLWTYISTALISALLVGCGSDTSTLSFSEVLEIGILGNFTAPADAPGNAEPKNVVLTLEDVVMTGETAGEVDLYTDESVELTVASRSQILLTTDMADYVDDTITNITVTFSAAGTAKGKYEEEMDFTFDTNTASYSDAFTVKTAQTNRFNVLVQWLNVVTRDDDAETETMSSPGLSIELVD